MTVKEYQAAHLPKSTYEGSMKVMQDLAKAIAERSKGTPQPKVQQPARRAADKAPDPIAALEQMEILSGKDMASVLREVQKGNLEPMQRPWASC
jgi:hypothetical protein